MRHTIRKQIFDLWVHRELDALALQQRVSDRFWMDILPELEKYFDNLIDDDSTIRIDRLEIDLGQITEEMIDTGEWVQLFREKLEKKLQEIMSDITLNRDVSIIPHIENVFNQWIYFIKHGYLPWNTPKLTDKWFQQVLESLAVNYDCASTLRELLAGNMTNSERIVMHHSPEFLSHLVELLTAEKQNTLPAAILDLSSWLYTIKVTHSPATGLTKKSIEQKIWTKVLQKVSVEASRQDTTTIIAYLFMNWLQLTNETLFALIKHQSVSEHFPAIGIIISKIVKDIEKKQQDALKDPSQKSSSDSDKLQITENGRIPIEKEESKTWKDQLMDSNLIDGQVLEQLSGARIKDSAATEEIAMKEQLNAASEGIFITQAGLVLLHPFIHTFFRKLELVKDGKFIDETKQERAVCLLHELASSGLAIKEFNLVLAKFLCAWPLHIPIDINIELTEVEKNEANRLLQAAIEQWEILKNTTPLALQETFLQREGKLMHDGKWLLQVEKNSVDLLLAHLPWMISMIKLPWMKEMLRVEWKH